MIDPSALHALWQKALESPVGISITTDDRKLLQRLLYKYRQGYEGNDFDLLAIAFPTDESELFIRKSERKAHVESGRRAAAEGND